MGWNLFGRLFEGDVADFQDLEDIYNTIMSLFCVLAAGFAAGLTMGLLSLDPTKMQMKAMTGSPWEKDAAMKIIPVIKQHHLLLVTLLLANSLANEALPVFLGALVPNYIAVIISVLLVLIFGEILPSAIFTGPNQLYMANKMVPLVNFVMTVLWPIAYPISRILDYFFGEEEASTVFSRKDFEALIQLQAMHNSSQNDSSVNRRLSSASNTAFKAIKGGDDNDNIDGLSEASSSPGNHTDADYGTISTTPQKEFLSSDEVKIMSGILNLSRQTVLDAMIPISNVFMISDKIKLGIHELQEILSSGFSRIPIFGKNDRRNILGFILVKQLVVISPSDNIGVDSLDVREPIILRPNVTLLEALSMFRKGQKTVQTKLPKSPSVGTVNNINNSNNSNNDSNNNNDSVHHSHIALISKDPMRALSMMRSFRLMNAEKKKSSFLTADYVRGVIDSSEESAILGIVTLEDVIEKIIQEDIIDETDVIADKSNKPAVGSSLAIHKKFTNSKGSKQSTFGGPRSRGSARLHSDSIDSYDSEAGLGSVSGSKLPGLGYQKQPVIMNNSRKNVENEGGSHFSPFSNISSSNYNSNNNYSNSNNNSNLSFASALNDSGGAMWFDDNDDGSDDFLSDGYGNDEENAAASTSTKTPSTPPSRRRRSVSRGGGKVADAEDAGEGSSVQQRRRGSVKGHHSTILSPRSGNGGSGGEEDFLNESTRLLHEAVNE